MADEKLPELTDAQRAAVRALCADHRSAPAPVWLARQAHVPNDVVERQHAAEDPEGFWREKAKLVDWMRPFDRVLVFDPPRHGWFAGGTLNATSSCIDRHTFGDRRLKAALIWVGEDGQEHTYTYNRLYREVNRLANALRKLGVRKGDRVVVYMPPTPEGILAMLACARIGAIHAVVSAGIGTRALRRRIEDCGAKVVVCSDFAFRRGKRLPLKPSVDEAVRDLYSVEHIVVHRRGSRRGDAPFAFESEREHDFYGVQQGQPIHCPPEAMDAEDPLFILYTSDAAGGPKGVVHGTGGYLVGTTYLARAFFQIRERDIYWSTADIGSILGHSFLVYGPLSIGATVFCREGAPDHPSPDVAWELCERFGIDVMLATPTAVRIWMGHGPAAPARHDLKRLRIVGCAGEPLDPEAQQWASQHLVGQSGGMVLDNFLQTEVAAPVLGTLPTFDARPGKVGKPLPGVDAAVVDRDGNEVPAGTAGLLVLRRPLPYMLRTIWNDPARYERYWSQIPGVYAAGDIVVKDRDGYFAMLGRADDMMTVAGTRIGSAEIESSLARHPAVAESAAVGLPDAVKGERIKAFVVLRPEVKRTPGLIGSLKDHVRQDLGPIATPSEIEIRTAVPKTQSGQLMRRYLKAVEMGEDPGDLSAMAD
jgi:acetyl-CoA synthetase